MLYNLIIASIIEFILVTSEISFRNSVEDYFLKEESENQALKTICIVE